MSRIYRHRLPTRLWHWINAVAVIILFMSGLMIFNAHPQLYWGHEGFNPQQAWLALERFPGWMTIPSDYSLADGRLWHFAFAWVLAIGLTLNFIFMLLNGHFRHDLALSLPELAPRRIAATLRDSVLRRAHDGGRYNVIQKIAYSVVLFLLLPGMIVSGLAMAPAMDAAWPWLVDMFGGRQSARSLHFIMAWSLFLFLFAVHMPALLLAGPVTHVRAMITGWVRSGEVP